MSIESVAIALHHSKAKGTAKLVLLGIANHDGDGGAFPKVATLAKYANVHPRRIVEIIKHLGQLGEIIIHTNEGGTGKTPAHVKPNLYEFVLECPPECDRTKHHRIPGEHLGRSYRGQYDPDRAKDPERVARGHAARKTQLEAVEKIKNTVLPPSAESSTSAENSTTPSAESSTTPSAENSTTKNHQIEPPIESGLVGTSPALEAGVEKPLVKVRPARWSVQPTPEELERTRRGAAAARAALRGSTEAKDGE